MHPAADPDARRLQRLAFAALLIANVVLAFGPWMVRLADVGPVAAGFWRLAIALPFLFAMARIAAPRPFAGITRGMAVTLLLGGLFFAADLAAWHAGILHTKLANATLFGNMSGFLLAAYGFVVMRMLPRPVQTIAIALAMVGTVLLLGSSYELSPQNLAGDLLTLLAGVFYACYLIAVDRARKALAPIPVLALATLAGLLPLLIAALVLGETVVPQDWTPLILLSLGSQVIGQGLLVFAMGHLSPLVVGLGLLMQPVLAAAIGWAAYGEGFSVTDAAGALLICVALVLIRLPERRAPA
ncbi:DMT family transporter [Allosphingosinicella indica]|uniref:EamA-like transporter family protein n=1 Tax=Allosphingosinicella indica TaxID=941907 RepID=A0A1X7G5Y8_9SPHN|nr:DMT family transporter [Allosphingosinicella indica]SMF64606.1 EamA-like transporter family protein [Allosphingosinicella indica]